MTKVLRPYGEIQLFMLDTHLSIRRGANVRQPNQAAYRAYSSKFQWLTLLF
jgi:hypothetical protein